MVERNGVLLSEMLVKMISWCFVYSSDESAFLKGTREFIESYAHLPDNEAGTLDALRKKQIHCAIPPFVCHRKDSVCYQCGVEKGFPDSGIGVCL